MYFLIKIDKEICVACFGNVKRLLPKLATFLGIACFGNLLDCISEKIIIDLLVNRHSVENDNYIKILLS